MRKGRRMRMRRGGGHVKGKGERRKEGDGRGEKWGIEKAECIFK
jgi:hypothetical protein